MDIVFRKIRRLRSGGRFVLLLVFLSGLVFLGGCGGGGGDGGPEGDLGTFLGLLGDAGFQVREGAPIGIDVRDLFCRKVLPSGFGNNLATPYLTLSVDRLPGTPENQFPWTYRLRQDEALVLIGRTPPKSVYFSLQHFAAMRYFEEADYSGRVYSLLGDTINHLTVRSVGAAAPFDSFFVMISTGNRTTERRLRSALLGAGYAETAVNVEGLPAELVRFGLDERSDQFNLLYRVAIIDDPEAERRFYETFGGMKVFRVTPGVELPADPFPAADLRERGTGTNEMHLLPTMKRLEDALIEAHPGYNVEKLPTAQWIADGYNPILQNIDAFAATNDTTYLLTQPFTLGEDDFLVAYGVLHDAAGKALYNSLNVYGWTLLEDLPDEPRFRGLREMVGVSEANSKGLLRDSARAYLPGDPNAGMFYAVKISRKCGADGCVPIPEPFCDRMKLKELTVAFRAYCEPKTKTGPSYGEILFDRVILFRRP